MNYKIRLVFVTFLFCTQVSYGQSERIIDSLSQLISHENEDTTNLRISLRIVDHFIRHNIDSGMKEVRKIQKEAEQLNYQYGQAESKRLIGEGYRSKNMYDSSLITFQQARKNFITIIKKKEETISGNYHSSLWSINEAIADQLIEQKKYDSAFYYINLQEESILYKSGNRNIIAKLLYSKSSFYYHTKNYESCIAEGLKLLTHADSITDELNAVIPLNTALLVAKTFRKLGDIKNAEKYFEKCIEIINRHNVPNYYSQPPLNSYALFLTNYAKEPELGGSDSLAQLKYYNKAKAIYYNLLKKKDETEFRIAVSNNNLAEVLYYTGEYKESIQRFEKAYVFFKESNFVLYTGVVKISLAKCYFGLKNLNKALELAEEGLQIVTNENSVSYQLTGHRVLFEIQEKRKEFEQALLHHKQLVHIKDSVAKEDELVKISDLESKFELGQREKDLEFKEKELALSEEVSESKTKTIWVFGGGLLLVLILSGFLFKSYREKKIVNGYLVEKQNIIEENLKEKEALLREVHHRVKNNLQVVSGMLQLQADKADDPKIDEIMQEGQERIKSMAIIHQRFYEGEELRDISFGEYLQELTKEIAASYGEEKFIKLDIADSKERFNIDTSIPLGIIVNELISNAYKHAFIIKDKGQIAIQLIKDSTNKSKIIVSDNGKGLPEGFDLENTTSMGLKLVRILVRQIKGELSFLNNDGAQFVISFPSNQK